MEKKKLLLTDHFYYCKLVRGLNAWYVFAITAAVYFDLSKQHPTWRGVGFTACLLDNTFINKIDCFTSEDGDRTTEFESIFTIL